MVSGMEGLKTILQKMVMPSQETFTSNNISEKDSLRLLARVIKTEGSRVMLHSSKGPLTGKVETPVFRGEQLLLEFAGIREGQLHFRILARSGGNPETLEGNQETKFTYWWSLLVNAGHDIPDYPLLVRYLPSQHHAEEENHYDNNNANTSPKVSFLELIVDTHNLGLIMIRIEVASPHVHCKFLVESQEAGEALEREARATLGEAEPLDNNHHLLDWNIHPVRKELAKNAPSGSFTLDQKA